MIHYAESRLEGLLTLEEAMAGLERVFVERANGAAPVQPRVPIDAGGLRLNTMAAILPALGVCGAKVYTALDSKFSFVVLLFSSVDGRVLASFDAGALTRLRTAAVSALAVRHLARPESATLAIFGTGTQAAGHAVALAARLPLREILVVGRGRADAFAREVNAVTGIRTSVSDAAAAVPRAEVIVTATRARTPLFDGNAVSAGCCIVAVGSSRPDTAEIDAPTLRRCGRIVVESAEQARHEAGDLIAAAAAGVAVWDRVTELGAILAGRAQGRTSAAEITLFESVGFALEDVAIAALAYSKLNP